MPKIKKKPNSFRAYNRDVLGFLFVVIFTTFLFLGAVLGSFVPAGLVGLVLDVGGIRRRLGAERRRWAIYNNI
jgi:hypothetical protein